MGRRVLHLGLFCLPMSNKKDVRLKWVNTTTKYADIFTTFPNYDIQKKCVNCSLIFLKT